jgi:hypothetical protein
MQANSAKEALRVGAWSRYKDAPKKKAAKKRPEV